MHTFKEVMVLLKKKVVLFHFVIKMNFFLLIKGLLVMQKRQRKGKVNIGAGII